MNTQTFNVKGMHCASCTSVITKSLQKIPGIESCDVNYATEKATLKFDENKVGLMQMNEKIGKYGYELQPSEPVIQMETSENHMNHTPGEHALMELKNKIDFIIPITATVFILMMWDTLAKINSSIPNFPIPMELFNLISFILSTITLFWIGKPYILAVGRFIRYGVSNMDTLVGIGTLVAYLYSSVVFLIPTVRSVLYLPEDVYFDVTIVVIGFITLGKYLESKSKLRTGEAIKKLINLQSKSALVIRGGKEIEIPINDVVVGDLIKVKPGGKIPVDGILTDGSTSVDESMINGEPIPTDKSIGDYVIGGTINKQGTFSYRAEKIGQDTMLSQIIKLVENAQNSKAPIQGLADKISSIFIPVVLIIALLSLVVWILIGVFFIGTSTGFTYGLLALVGVLVIACPCALGLATPTAIIVGVGKGAENGILIKNAEALEQLHKINTLVFDKTGTITSGKPVVTDIKSLSKKYNEDEMLFMASSLENNSSHPLANAISEYGKQKWKEFALVTEFKEVEGSGVEGMVKGVFIKISKPVEKDRNNLEIVKLEKEGKTVVKIEENSEIIGIIGISDEIKKGALEAIKKIHKLGIKTVMLTGDNAEAAKYMAAKAGIDDVRANVHPKDKSDIIMKLQSDGKIIGMVGDGINDAPALSQANIGIAMATGSDIAIDSADVILLNGDITKVFESVLLSKYTIRTVKQNLFWAFIYNLIGIPLAAGVFYPLLGIFLNPIYAGSAMAMSSVSVVANSLLLKKVKL